MLDWVFKSLFFFTVLCLGSPSIFSLDTLTPFGHKKSSLEPPQEETLVKIGINIDQVTEIEAPSNDRPMLYADVNMRLSWKDKRLRVAAKSDQHSVHVFQDEEAKNQLNRMFDPKIAILDGTMETTHQHLRIYPDGRVVLDQNVSITVPANLDLLRFPFDTQTFALHFASNYWTEKEVQLSLNLLESGLNSDAAPESWEFKLFNYHIASLTGDKHHERYSTFVFLIHAERNPWYFLWRLLIPLMVIVLLSWNVFWVYSFEVQSLENCLIFLLTVVVYQDTATGMLPTIPYLTLIDQMVYISYGFTVIPTVLFLISAVLTYKNLDHISDRARKICRWAVPMLFLLCMSATTLKYFL